MPWREPLPKPIVLTDGRILETLLDARNRLVQEDLYHQPGTRRALELLLDASKTGDPAAIELAADQVAVVLGQRGLIG